MAVGAKCFEQILDLHPPAIVRIDISREDDAVRPLDEGPGNGSIEARRIVTHLISGGPERPIQQVSF
jgi:hypothetical protein